MIHAQNSKSLNLIVPQSVGTEAVTGTADTLGYDYATVETVLDTASTSTTITTLSLAEGDTTSAYTAIDAFTAGTASDNFTAPAAPGTSGTGQVIKFEVDLRARKRYLRLSLANSAARLSAAKIELHRAAETPVTDDERGCAEVVYG